MTYEHHQISFCYEKQYNNGRFAIISLSPYDKISSWSKQM